MTMTRWMFSPSSPGTTRNTASWHISRQNHEGYQIDVSWPLKWATQQSSTANVLYLVDGNAMFLTATDALRRRAASRPDGIGTIVVAVGYPLTDTVYSPRREYDLTLPCDDYVGPLGKDGKSEPHPYGGADKFLAFITEVVRPFVVDKLFSHVSIAQSALFGHSLGGLFTLHALFTRPSSFDMFLAASPSIWWCDRFILTEAERFCDDKDDPTCPIVRMSYGAWEQHPVREPGEPWDDYQRRRETSEHHRMADNCRELHSLLLNSRRVQNIQTREYPDEDHGSVIAPALTGAILYFLQQTT